MQRDDLAAHEVVSGFEVRDRQNLLSLVGYQAIGSPLAVAVSVLSKLHPDVSSTVGSTRSNIYHDRTLVGLIGLCQRRCGWEEVDELYTYYINDIVRGIGRSMMPLYTKLSTVGQ